jgi:hypothetical protein
MNPLRKEYIMAEVRIQISAEDRASAVINGVGNAFAALVSPIKGQRQDAATSRNRFAV